MTPQQIVGLGVRLLAVWIVLRGLDVFLMNASAFRAMNLTDKVINTALLTVWWLGVAGLMWLFPMWIAHRLIPRTKFENKLDLNALDAARVGCCLIGLWIFANQLNTFVWLIFHGALSPGDSSVIRQLADQEKIQFLAVAIQLLFSIALIFGSARFATLALGSKEKTAEVNADSGDQSQTR